MYLLLLCFFDLARYDAMKDMEDKATHHHIVQIFFKMPIWENMYCIQLAFNTLEYIFHEKLKIKFIGEMILLDK